MKEGRTDDDFDRVDVVAGDHPDAADQSRGDDTCNRRGDRKQA